ncbi:aspartate/glutamate racemase family protein [Microbulbifer sp. GL-2]|uniref:aspartate/glutamate racemase family protein n=1 Tax=Microbulbifer sp. GL-2 TaxID=2591606 RepID=UPI001162C1A8|nr:aspartate/glutamate racemase family protein [Microbulbifer sp. GL-2]BBM00279.1 aspartate racemase [Microbulbifer sp. GL-2]
MSWESTQTYYQLINEGVNRKLGGLHSAEIILYSVDFAKIEKLQGAGEWEESGQLLASAAQGVQTAGADCILICTNTMHKVASQVELSIDIPLLHIADATAEVLVQRGVRKAGLLGTAFTMEQDFYRQRIQNNYGVTVIVPEAEDRKKIHSIIFDELCKGELLKSSKEEYLRIIQSLSDMGAEAVILGCTEIGLLVSQDDTQIPLLDTTRIHADKAVEFALSTS